MREEDGITAVKIARSVITQEVTKQQLMYMMHIEHNEPSGVFVTMNTHPDGMLRGCIGFTEHNYPFLEALEYAARSACHDPRFPALGERELDKIVVEVTILTRPSLIKVKNREDLPKEIKIGRDGLMIEYRGRRGVFLPQVPVEWEWNVTEYLENLCRKAGIGKDKWKENDCDVFSFRGRSFKETSPGGDVTEVIGC